MISFFIFSPGIVVASNDIGVNSIWTVSKDMRIWIQVETGEQVGFSNVVCILQPNESITINIDVFRSNKSIWSFFQFNYSDSTYDELEINYRGLFAVVVIDNSVKVQSEKRQIFIGGMLIDEFLIYIWPVTIPFIIFSIWSARYIKRRSEGVLIV